MSLVPKLKNVHSKHSRNASGCSGTLVSGYNPILGKFHTMDTSAESSVSPLRINSRFSSIDETNDPYGISIGSVKEYDSVSNNSSLSGDSEDHKEKPVIHIPPLHADNEKREKIRLKNEKKHQRQKERRVQELHDRCTGFLVSRKLEALMQQLVAMGFSSEGATMALTMNQGKIEESILWLIKEGEGANKHKEHKLHVGNLKVDISDELARIADFEIRYKCFKQDAERVVVACEGDLKKAEEILSASQRSLTTQLKPTESTFLEHKGGEQNSSSTTKNVASGVHVDSERDHPQNMVKSQLKLDLSPSLQRILPQQKSETQYLFLEKEFNDQQVGKRDQVVLMQRPQSGNPQWVPPTGSVTSSVSTNHLYDEDQHYRQVRFNNNGTGDKRGNSPTIAVASSLGLYSGTGSTRGSSGLSSPMDWNSVGSLFLQLDYTNVDWTLNPNPPRSNMTGTWQGIAADINEKRRYDPYPSAVAGKSGGLREWSLPFEERDVFTLPRQFVSPYL